MFMSIFNLMGAQTDRFRYEVFQNLFFSPMNTGFLRDTVATVLTVYGIETCHYDKSVLQRNLELQQYLPFTVLKLKPLMDKDFARRKLQQYLPFTVLKPVHINPLTGIIFNSLQQYLPFTVLKQ